MRFGPYETTATLGQGGMGVVFAARSREGREVAIKVLHRRDGDVLARFERERRLLASLGEAVGFVPLLDAGTTPSGPYLVMPLVPGGTLRQKLEAGALGVDETVALGRRLALALGAAHARGMVHRDVKPENVLFTATGLPLIADLGIAKHFDPRAPGASQSVSLSQHGALRGTAGYMAPEQMADAKIVGPAADVFALGAILYECLAGEPPFIGENAIELLTRVSEGKFEPLRERKADVPRWLAAVVERALAPAAWDRFPDGLALGRALGGGEARASRGSRRFLAVALILLVLAGAVALAAFIRSSRANAVIEAREVARGAIAAVDSGDVVRGEREANRAFELDPSCGLAFTARGELLWLKGDRAGAMGAHARAVELDPASSLAWHVKAYGEVALWHVDQAIADFTKALDVSPRAKESFVGRAVARNNKGDYDGAIADANRAIAIDPSFAPGFWARGVATSAKGDHEAGIRDLDRAIELGPKRPEIWLSRAVAKTHTADRDGSIADFTRSIELNGKQAFAWSERGIVRLTANDNDGAIADLTRALELEPHQARSLENRGYARANKGDSDGAIADLTEALERNPSVAVAWAKRGFLRKIKGDIAGAIDDYERFLELAPDHEQAAAVRAEMPTLRARANKQ